MPKKTLQWVCSDEEVEWPDNLDTPLYSSRLRAPIPRPDQRTPAEVAEDLEHERRYASVAGPIRQFDHGLLPMVNDGQYIEQGRNILGEPQQQRLRQIESRPQALRDKGAKGQYLQKGSALLLAWRSPRTRLMKFSIKSIKGMIGGTTSTMTRMRSPIWDHSLIPKMSRSSSSSGSTAALDQN